MLVVFDVVVDAMRAAEKGLPAACDDGARAVALILARGVAGMLGDGADAGEQLQQRQRRQQP